MGIDCLESASNMLAVAAGVPSSPCPPMSSHLPSGINVALCPGLVAATGVTNCAGASVGAQAKMSMPSDTVHAPIVRIPLMCVSLAGMYVSASSRVDGDVHTDPRAPPRVNVD